MPEPTKPAKRGPRKVPAYTIVVSMQLGDLVDKVNAKIAEGWSPIGGAFTIGDHSFGQTMVK